MKFSNYNLPYMNYSKHRKKIHTTLTSHKSYFYKYVVTVVHCGCKYYAIMQRFALMDSVSLKH